MQRQQKFNILREYGSIQKFMKIAKLSKLISIFTTHSQVQIPQGYNQQ